MEIKRSTDMDAIWIGTRGNEQWVPAPIEGPSMGRAGYTTSIDYLNGGTWRRGSKTAHKMYQWEWGHHTRDALRPISDLRAGVYGDGLIYFVDPFAANFNVLPMQWAFPAQACYDAPPLYGNVRPTKADTSGNHLKYPVESALYKYQVGANTKELYLPVPPGYTAWVGVHGSVSGTAGLWVEEVDGAAGYATMLDVADENRVVDSHTGVSGLVLSVRLTSGSNLTLSGMIVQILPDGIIPDTGEYISGQGHSGCMFDTDVEELMFNSYRDDVKASATFVEVGDWL